MSRMAAIENEHRRTQEGSGGKFDYVNTRALERLGIKQLKLVAGDNFLRIISPKFSQYPPDKLPFYGREVFVHYNVGSDRRTYICMKRTANKPCPVCELAEQIRAQNPEDKRLNELYASCRYVFFVYNVKDTSTEALGLHWLDAPRTIKDNIVTISKDRRTGAFVDVSDPTEGADIEFSRVGTRLSTKYEGFKLDNHGDPPAEWYANVPDDFDEFLLWPKYEQVYEQVFGGAPTAPGTDPAPIVDPAPTPDPAQTAPTRTRPAPAPAAAPAPAPAPAAAPAPAPAPAAAPAPPPAPAPAAAPATRNRSDTPTGSPITPDVQARIDQLKNGGA